ncbi:solute carrier family 35 member C2-like isoform X2 [Panonychus citri]|uniref:solute carrier family 35 member C2-like isoform X2 n=1 Tax=Panonychus citri TaxID=50023 RepID=UPI0023076C6F|nr:solute carrier family 35 member C2-like isoform X2 [Panonychus citri]
MIIDRVVCLKGIRTLSLIILYYCFSIGITFYQKWFLKGFHFPFLVVTCHMIMKFLLSAICRIIMILATGNFRATLNCSANIKKLATIGFASALDIGFSNWSFEYITISLYTMTKSTCIIFILGFAIIFGLEKKRISLVVVVILISSGLLMFTYHSTQFSSKGFILVLIASFLGGLRWTLAQLLMQRKDMGLSNPVDMMYHVQPWMILSLLPFTFTFEALPLMTSSDGFAVFFNTYSFIYILIGSFLAFLMELSEYLLITYTSSLTLSIAGIFKEVFTLYIAIEYSRDEISRFNAIGLAVCLTGISLHVYIRAREMVKVTDKRASQSTSTEHLMETEQLLINGTEDI